MIATLVLIFSIAASDCHAGLHHPFPAELDAISKELHEASLIRERELRPVEDRLKELRLKSGHTVTGIYMWSELTTAEIADLARASGEYVRIIKSISPHLDAAVQLTLRSYGISNPKIPLQGPIRSGPPNRPDEPEALERHLGQQAVFQPKFSPSLPQGTLGLTDNAGKVLLGWSAFAYPGKLAATLYHELEHERDLLRPDRDLRNDAAVELRVRSSQRTAMVSYFNLNAKDMRRYDEILAALPNARKLWAEKIAEGWDPYRKDHWKAVFHPILGAKLADTPADDIRGSRMTDNLEDILSGAEDLSRAIVEEQRDRAETAEFFRDRREREMVQKEEESAVKSLHAWAESACWLWDGSHVADLDSAWERWRDAHLHAVARQSVPVDLAIFIPQQRFSCPDFFTNQVQVRKARGEGDFSLTAVFSLIQESRRAAEVRPPARAHAEPAPPPAGNNPPGPRPQPPVVLPGDDSGTPPPAVPHCRYPGDWCKQ